MSKKIIMREDEGWIWRKLHQDMVSFESVAVQSETKYGEYALAVVGRVRVVNWFFQKHVFARISFDNWKTYQDFRASYLESSDDGTYDVFVFGFTRRDTKPMDVEFAVTCMQGGLQRWDNNEWRNYRFHLSENPFQVDSQKSAIIARQDFALTSAENPGLRLNTRRFGGESCYYASDYPQFKAHPLTPTNIAYYAYSTDEHVAAQDASVECATIEPEVATEQEAILQTEDGADGYIQADNVEVTVTEDNQGESQPSTQQEIDENHVSEEKIEPVKHDRSNDVLSQDEIHERLEANGTDKEGLNVELQIIEEPGSPDATGEVVPAEDGVKDQQKEGVGVSQSEDGRSPEVDGQPQDGTAEQKEMNGDQKSSKDRELIGDSDSDGEGASKERGGCGRFFTCVPTGGKKKKKKNK